MSYVWLIIGVVVACLGGALWWERDRAADLATQLGASQSEVRRLVADVLEAKDVADTNRKLANFWREETVRAGVMLAEAEERAAKVHTRVVTVIQEISRAPKASEPVPAPYDLVHRRLRELAAPGADAAGAPGVRGPAGAPGPDFHPSARPDSAGRRPQR